MCIREQLKRLQDIYYIGFEDIFQEWEPTYCEYCPVSCSWISVVSVDVQSGLQDMMKHTHAHILVMEKNKNKKKDQED